MAEEKEIKVKKKKDFSSYFLVVAFLALEVVAFLSFSLGFSFLLYGILSVVLLALLILVTIRQINVDGLSRVGFLIFPLLIFGLLTAVSIFTQYQQYVKSISTADVVFIPIAFAAYVLIGYLLSLNKQFKVSTLMLVVFSALSLYVLINFIATMIQFGPFYAFRYPNSKFYYGGEVSPEISKLAYAVIGFEVTEVSSQFYCLFPTVLLSSAVALFFINPKTEIKKFILYSAFALLGFISMLFVANKIIMIFEALYLIVLGLVVALVKYHRNVTFKKVIKTICIVVLVLVLLGVIIVFLNAQTDWSFTAGLRNAIASNALLNRLFNANRVISPINEYLVNIFSKDKIFGFYQYNPGGIHPITKVVASSGIFLIDNLASSGLFGAIAILIFLIVGIKYVYRLLLNPLYQDKDKALLIGFVTIYFFYILFNNVFDVAIFAEVRTNYYLQGLFLVVLIIIGYCFSVNKKEAKKNEEQK